VVGETHERRFAVFRVAARRRTEGAGGFFGIEGMSKRTTLEGRERGVSVVMAVLISA
jgi:hypothetical protein